MSTDLPQLAASRHDGPPRRLGKRYDASGFLPEAGNTIVCHLDHAHPSHAAVLRARDRVRAQAGEGLLLFTPESSLHMTVFEGVIETRRTADAWPQGLDTTASIEEATDHILPRLAELEPLPPFEVAVTAVSPTGLYLDGASEKDREAMRVWRDALARPFGFRHREHSSYRFHMTFAYILAWFPDAELPVWKSVLGDILGELVEKAPLLPLKQPAFCVFKDMTHFEERLTLNR
jgi:hypothetical protein